MQELAKIDSFRKELALAETIEEIKLIGDSAAAYQYIMKRQGMSKSGLDNIGELMIDTEVFKGGWLDKYYPHGVRSDRRGSDLAPLNNKMPVSKKESSRAKRIKKFKEEKPGEFEKVKDKIKNDENSILNIKLLDNELNRSVKLKEQQDRFSLLKDRELNPVNGKYDVIVIDPPWEMEKIKRDVAPMQVGFDYPTMSIDQIKEFKLPAEENCHVFMWITHKHLPYGFEIFNHWNVKYVCCFVWHKNGGFQPFGLPQYNCEFVLYGRIGTPEFYDLKDFNVCFSADRTGHSEKPELFYNILKRVTAGKRTDIFSRRNIDGFENWGNEL